MILRTAIFVVLILGVVAALALSKPNTVHIQRSTRIRASPAAIYSLIGDFHQWHLWAPQDREDPTMQRTYGGSAAGMGSISEWRSRGSAGAGRMEIIAESAPQSIRIRVDFTKPFEAHNINDFALRPAADATEVSWTMNGSRPFILKLMSVFVSPDHLMGKHFEAGLANLKAAAEQQAP